MDVILHILSDLNLLNIKMVYYEFDLM